MVCIVSDNPISRFINGSTPAYVLYGISMALISAAIESVTLLLAANLFISIVIIAGSAAGSKIIYDRLNNKT